MSPYELQKLLARNFLVGLCKDVPGILVQVGVGSGHGLVQYAQLLDLERTHQTDRIVLGFDSFDFYPTMDQDEQEAVQQILSDDKNQISSASLNKVHALISEYDKSAPFPQRGKSKIEVIAGNIEETIGGYDFQGRRISLLEVDVNTRQATAKALEVLAPLVVPGGLIVFGGYASGPWKGESEVVHRFCAENGLKPRRVSKYLYPSAFVVV